MKFVVSASLNTPPCEEAFQEAVVSTDVRDVADLGELTDDQRGVLWWYSYGSHHRVVNGQIMRDFTEVKWIVELNDLDELIVFAEKYGGEVTIRPPRLYSLPTIEMFDPWRVYA